MQFKTAILSLALAAHGSVDIARANAVTCPNTTITVASHQPETTDLICAAAARADTLFGRCQVPQISRPLKIEVVETIKDGCVALYHCDDDVIRVLPPDPMQARRDADGAFAHLGIESYFTSVIVHELAHAANADMPCPYESCVVADEYVAYALQIMSLPPEDQTAFVDRSNLDGPVLAEELSAVILFMAPDLFAQKVWAHLQQQDSPCDYIGALSRGRLTLDQGQL